MTPEPGLGSAFVWSFWFLGEIVFKWIPGAVVTFAGKGVPPGPGEVAPILRPVTEPVTAPQIVEYLQTASAPGVYDTLFERWSVFVALSLFVSLLLAALIIYCSIRIFQVRQMERRRFAALQRTVAAHDVPKTQLRWNRILEQAHSEDPQSWRLAILEADIMLNELLDTLGYKGETMADKMRAVDRANFNTIDLAWEVHKIRNKVAHAGVALELNSREVRRIMSLYERVFREFRFIE